MQFLIFGSIEFKCLLDRLHLLCLDSKIHNPSLIVKLQRFDLLLFVFLLNLELLDHELIFLAIDIILVRLISLLTADLNKLVLIILHHPFELPLQFLN